MKKIKVFIEQSHNKITINHYDDLNNHIGKVVIHVNDDDVKDFNIFSSPGCDDKFEYLSERPKQARFCDEQGG